MKNVIVITGASSGIGALAARALALAGHTVYASMRQTLGRNAPQAKAAQRWGIENSIIVPGAFTAGTSHFAHAGRPPTAPGPTNT